MNSKTHEAPDSRKGVMNLHSHFTDEEIEAQRVVVFCQSYIVRSKGTERGLSAYNACPLFIISDDRKITI